MSKKDIFGDEVNETKDFASFEQLFAQSEKNMDRKLRVGDTFKGEILSIGKEEAFVSTGTPADGMMFTRDLMDENKQVIHSVGDVIDCVVTALKGGEVRVAKKGAKGVETDSLEDAFDMELPVEGRVTEAVNGGFRVSLSGKTTAFCPISQIDLRFVTDTAEYVNKKFEFLITQFDAKGRNIVVSRRKVLEMQKAENEGAFMQKYEAGSLLEGKIMRLERFGAFVELEAGVEGLIHISELAWSRIHDPKEVVSTGQTVTVKLLKTEEVDGKLKISLSLKQADGEGNPWSTITQRFPQGTVVKGTVEKKETYGLFVNLAPGITGLLPKSKYRDSVDANQYDSKKRGDDIMVQVDQISLEDKKISLGVPGEGEDNSWRQHQTGSSSSGFASFGDALKGFSLDKKK